jgi:MoxR-like ATPase
MTDAPVQTTAASIETFSRLARAIEAEVARVIVGQNEVVRGVLICVLAGRHALLEGVPGLGKTMLIRALADALDLKFARIQFTPDLMPADITGTDVLEDDERGHKVKQFQPGPVFANLMLADEINRATPKTQSALLEAMQEQQVTVDGVSRALPRPFLVLATQNPIEYEGTFPLPEAQLDRFLLRLSMGYPSAVDERQLLTNLRREHPITHIQVVADASSLLELQRLVWEVHVDATLEEYIIRLVTATRQSPDLALGASPRASLALYKTAQALAAIRGRDHILPDDIKYLAPFALTHRLIVRPESELRGRTAKIALADILAEVPLNLGA